MADLYVADSSKKDKKKERKGSAPLTRRATEGKKEKKVSKKPRLPETELEELKRQRTTNPLASFLARPFGIRFETQEKDEEIILLLRRHWVTNVRWLVLSLILLLAPTFLRYLPLLPFLPTRFQVFSIILWYLFVIAFILEQFLTWFFNVNIITDERLVDIDFYNLLYKQITEAKIDRIQDITLRMGGAIRTLFNYGDVLIQTAGAEPNLEFEAVPKPDHVVRALQELRTEEEIEALEGRIR